MLKKLRAILGFPQRVQ